MFADCEDDLCIFVCGTCKRYFTQLSAFAQHKKEQLCRKKNFGVQERWFASNFLTSNHIPEGNSEDVDSDALFDNQDFGDCSNEHHTAMNEENDCNSQKRKYPRKQDKTKIKRTVRDFETETHAMRDGLEREDSAARQSQNTFPTFPFSSHVRTDHFFGQPSETVAFCQHPVYMCKVCHKEFPKPPGKPYRCSQCRRGYLTERELKVHVMRAKHDKMCNVCGKIFPDKYKLRKHTLSHVTEKNFPCDFPGCSKAFKSAEDVRTHVKYVHAIEKRFKCTQCMKAFTRPDKFKQHLLTHKGGKQSIGDWGPSEEQSNDLTGYNGDSSVGDTSYKNNLELEHTSEVIPEHETSPLYDEATNAAGVSMADTNPVFDSLPGEHARESNTFKIEDNTEWHPPRGYYQPIATSLRSGQPSIEVLSPDDGTHGDAGPVIPANTKTICNPELSPHPYYECHNCGLNFDDKEALDQHAKMHTQVLANAGEECARCQTRFRTNNEFVAHEERRPDNVLRCEHCSLKFLSICELRFHLRDCHNIVGEPEVNPVVVVEKSKRVVGQPRKHVCGECGKGFTRADKLRRHSIIHSPDRPCIPCMCRESHGCLLSFYRKDSMKRHALTHTLEKPYKCDVCDKTFSRQDYFAKHVSQVHKPVFEHRCMICDYGTPEPKRLRIHIRSRHEIDPNTLLPLSAEEKQNTKEEPGTNSGNLVPPGEAPPMAEGTPTTVTKIALDDSYPLPLSDIPEIIEVSTPDGRISGGYIDQESPRGPRTMPEGCIRHYGSMPAIPAQNSSAHFPSQDLQMMPTADAHSYNRHQVSQSGRKTPLNSLTVPPQQSFYGVDDVIENSSRNFFT